MRSSTLHLGKEFSHTQTLTHSLTHTHTHTHYEFLIEASSSRQQHWWCNGYESHMNTHLHTLFTLIKQSDALLHANKMKLITHTHTHNKTHERYTYTQPLSKTNLINWSLIVMYHILFILNRTLHSVHTESLYVHKPLQCPYKDINWIQTQFKGIILNSEGNSCEGFLIYPFFPFNEHKH